MKIHRKDQNPPSNIKLNDCHQRMNGEEKKLVHSVQFSKYLHFEFVCFAGYKLRI